jgi:8-amino-7-oxononanoate synthase
VFPSPRRDRRLYGESSGLISFASNDYLGLAEDKDLLTSVFLDTPPRFGSSGSRLLGGDLKAHHVLEATIAEGLTTEAGLCFNSGYHTNVGVLSAILEKNDVVFADKLCHASIIDGILLSGAKLLRFRHNDMAHLKALLTKYRSHYKDALILSESCFSMDGDCADLEALISLKKAFSCRLYIDEAHAIGVMGENGYGLCPAYSKDIDFIVGGFGKALGSVGGYLGCTETIKAFLINSCRAFIYSTSLPLPVLNWNSTVWKKLPELQDRRASLNALITTLKQHPSNLITSNTHISPIIIGSDEDTLSIAKKLNDEGFFVPAIRPPTVPENASRLRLSLRATHTEAQLHKVLDCVAKSI